MKISTKGRYGLTIMMELAAKFGEGPSLKSIAEKNSLSEHYLEQLITPLRNAGLVKSLRGAYGGYILSKDPETITVRRRDPYFGRTDFPGRLRGGGRYRQA